MARRKAQNTNTEDMKLNVDNTSTETKDENTVAKDTTTETNDTSVETKDTKLCHVMVINRFYDIRAEVTREVGEVFECTDERYTEIMQAHPHLVKKTNKKVGTQRHC